MCNSFLGQKIGPRSLQSGFVVDFLNSNFLRFFQSKICQPQPVCTLFLRVSGPFVLVWLSWLCSASQPFAGSSMVVVCWLDLGVSCIQAGMKGLIRSNGPWQTACTSWSTYGLKSGQKPRPWSGRRWTCSAWADAGHLSSTCAHRKGPSCW